MTFNPAGLMEEMTSTAEKLAKGYDTLQQIDTVDELRFVRSQIDGSVGDVRRIADGARRGSHRLEPSNALLQELLLKTYREELAVMRKVGGLTQDVMLRNDI